MIPRVLMGVEMPQALCEPLPLTVNTHPERSSRRRVTALRELLVELAQLPQFEGVRFRISNTYGKSRHYTTGVSASVAGMRNRSGRSSPRRSRRAA